MQLDITSLNSFSDFATDEALARRYIDMAGQFAVNLTIAVLILVFTFWLSGKLSKLI
jgi:hypothetical protein